MKKSIFFRLLVLGFFVGLGMGISGGAIAFAADVQAVVTLDRSQVTVGDEAFLTIRILDGRGNIQAPQIPALRDLDIHYTGRASKMSFVNGVSSSSLEFSYIVSPRRAGSYTIPPLAVSVNGALLQTNAVQFQAVDGGYTPQAPATPRMPTAPVSPQTVKTSSSKPPAGADSRIFAEAQLSKFSVYQNEQTLLNYALFTSYDTRYEGFETEPELSGFWIEEFPSEKDVPREVVKIGSRQYIRADIKKMALFPTSPGKYTIQPGKIKTTVKQDQQQDNVFDEFFNDSFFNGGNFFSKRETRILAPKALEIEVKPLPEAGKPQGFQGDVGSYQMNATLDRTEVKQNEPVKMTLVIEGVGNVDRVNRPRIPDLKGFRTYEADSKSEVSRQNDKISGRKTFEVVFIPRDEGKMFIPPLEFSFFDPLQGQYQTLRTPNYQLTVLKGDAEPALPEDVTTQTELKKEVQMEAKDIRYVETKWPTGRGLAHQLLPLTAILNLLALAFVGFSVYQKNREVFISQNRGLYRNKKARSIALSEMNVLKKLARENDLASQTEFFEYLERALNQYFADKWDLSAQGTARSEIDRRLRDAFGNDDPICQEVAGVYQLCDESRFGRGIIPESSKALALRVFHHVVEHLERIQKC